MLGGMLGLHLKVETCEGFVGLRNCFERIDHYTLGSKRFDPLWQTRLSHRRQTGCRQGSLCRIGGAGNIMDVGGQGDEAVDGYDDKHMLGHGHCGGRRDSNGEMEGDDRMRSLTSYRIGRSTAT